MGNFIYAPIKKLKGHIKSNQKMYLIVSMLILMGIILGIYLVLSGFIDDIIYTSTDLDLSEIVLGERSNLSLFFLNFKSLIIPCLVIFLLYTNRYTGFLAYFYMGYQGILLGASVTSVIGEAGIAGALNSLLIILPINLLNFFIMTSFLVVCYKRLMIAKIQRLSFMYSIRLFIGSFLGCLLGAIFASFVYGFIYPILLKTAIVVSV